jgi:parvulin-like peptidyl-prolyl isomerase
MYHTSGRVLLALTTLFIANTAWAAQTKNVEQIVAWVNNDIILKSEYDARVAEIRKSLADPSPEGQGLQGQRLEQAVAEQSKRVLAQLIDETLLMQQAKELGISADIEVVKAMDRLRQERKLPTREDLEKEILAQGFTVEQVEKNIRTSYLTQRVIESEVYRRMPLPTQDEIRKYYDAHQKDFDRPAGVRLREIVILTENRGPELIEGQRKKAEEALAAIKKGDDFGETAAKYSETDTARDGGELPFYEKGQMQPWLEEITNKLDKGQVSDVIPVLGAFMIVKVDDKHPGGILPFELAQREISDVLWREAAQPKIRDYLTKLRTDGFVKTAEGYVDVAAPQKTDKVSEAKD